MKIFKVLLSVILVASYISFGPLVKANENNSVVEFADDTNIVQWATSTEVPVDKEWEIEFNKDVNNQVKISDFIYVLDSSGAVVEGTDVAFNHAKKTIVVQAPVEGYATNSTYTLVIEEGFSTTAGEKLQSTNHKKFTTNGEALVVETFEPRFDATNKIEVVDNLYQVSIADSLSENYESGKVILSKDTLYMVGDFISLPETEDYPFGFVGQITAIEEQDNSIIYTIITPNLTDVVTDIDVSQIADVEAERVVLSDDLFIQNYSEEFRMQLMASSSFARIVETDDGFKIVLMDLGAEVEDKKETDNIRLYGKGGISFTGDIEFKNPKVYADLTWLQLNELGFSADQTFNLNAKAYGNIEGVLEFTLAEVPVPYLGVKTPIGSMGTVIELRLVLEAKANGTIEYSIKQTIREQVGVRKTDNGFIPNASVKKIENKASLDAARIDLSMDKGFNVALLAKIAQWDIAGIGLRPTISTTVSAGKLYENSLANACYELSADLRFRIKAEVSIFDGYVYDNFDKSYNLAKLTDCFVNEIKFKDDQLSVTHGERKKLELTASLGDVENVTLSLPHQFVSFTSSSRYVTVDNTGTYHVSASAPDNLAATITVRLKYGDKAHTDNVKLIVKAKDQEEKENGEDDPQDTENGEDQQEIEEIEELKFAQNFKITNSGDRKKYMRIDSSGYPIVFDSNGKIIRESQQETGYVDIPAGGYAIVSYLTIPISKPTSTDSDFSIEEVSEAAYQAFQLYKNNKLYVKNTGAISEGFVIADTELMNAEYSVVSYNDKGSVDTQVYKSFFRKSYSRYIYANKNEIIIKNTDSDPFIVLVPTVFDTAEQTSEEPFVEKKIATNEVVRVTTSETIVNDYLGSAFYIKTETGRIPPPYLWKNGSVGAVWRETDDPYSSVSKDREKYIKNPGTSPIVVSGAARYIKIEIVE